MPSVVTLAQISHRHAAPGRPSLWRRWLARPLEALQRELEAKKGLGLAATCARLLSVAAHPVQHWQVVRALGAPGTCRLLESYPRAVYRYTLPYLSMNFGRQLRQQMLRAHYDFINHCLHPSFYQRVLDDTMVLWQQELDGSAFSISVAGPCRHREGDLTLVFKKDGQALYRIAFSVIPFALLQMPAPPGQHASEHIFYVGQVQGYPGGFEELRAATRICRDVAPGDMLMAALAGLASALGIELVAGVGFENSLSHHNLVRLNSSFSYADFWEKHHGVRWEGGHYFLQVPLAEKPIQLVKANHRKRTLLKREFKSAIGQEACEVMRPLVIPR